VSAASSTTAAWTTYDDLAGSAGDARWEDRAGPGDDGIPVPFCDETAVVTTGPAGRQVRIERFTRRADGRVQNLDNPKHLVVSTETFEVPDGGTAEFRVDMAAERIGGDAADYRDGFATFNVIDVEHKLVVDVILTGSQLHTIYELQAVPVGVVPVDESFLYVVDNPELGLDVGPGSWHTCTVAIDRAAGGIEATADGRTLFRTGDLPVDPRRIKLGMGILTLQPLAADGTSTSCRGQGMVARWRDVRVRLSEAARG